MYPTQLVFSHKSLSILLLVLLLSLLIIHVITLHSFPVIRSADEPMILLMLRSFPDTHRFDMPTSLGWAPIHARVPRGYLLYVAGVSIFDMNWIAIRFISLCVGMATLAVVFFTGRRLYGYQAGLIATCFAATSSTFFVTAHHIRLDIFLAFMIAVTFFAHTVAKEKNSRLWHFLTGLLLVLSYEAHQNAVVFIFSFGIYYAVDCVNALIKKRQTAAWFALSGVIVGAILWALIHVIPSPHDFQQSLEFTRNERPFPITETLSPIKLYEQYKEAGLAHYFADAPIELIISGIVIFFGLISRRTNAIASLVVLSHVGAMLFLTPYRPVYFVNGLPLLALVAGGLLTAVDSLRYKSMLTLTLLGTLLISTLHLVIPIAQENWNSRIIKKVAILQQVIPDGSVVFSSPLIGLGLGPNTKIEDFGNTHFMLDQGKTLEEGMNQINAEFIVYFVHETPPHHLSEYWGIETWYTHLDSQNPYVQANYGLILVEPGVYGHIEVYKKRIKG